MQHAHIQVSDSALHYLRKIAGDEGKRELRVGIQHPGSNISQCYLSFASDCADDDEVVDFDGFRIRFRRLFAGFIDGLELDYRTNRMGGHLHIKAPNLHRLDKPADDADLAVRANWVLQQYVNPQLAEHQGSALVDRAEGSRIWLKFGGNCLGCGNAEKTLVNFVEKVIREHLPEVEAISEVTMH